MLIFYASKWWCSRHRKPNGTCSVTLIVDKFSELFLHPSVFFVKHSRYVSMIIGALSDFCYWLNSNILVSLEGTIMLQKYVLF